MGTKPTGGNRCRVRHDEESSAKPGQTEAQEEGKEAHGERREERRRGEGSGTRREGGTSITSSIAPFSTVEITTWSVSLSIWFQISVPLVMKVSISLPKGTLRTPGALGAGAG